MGIEINYEKLVEQAKELAASDQLRLISDLSASLSNRIHSANQSGKTSADFYGVMQGVTYDESDFEAAEWRPEL
ncbi:MAG TPA: hypothetical protein VLR90_03645 [Blastocatellia bacterium]|nr:hypothetical protein [Blastocatellia bacterium]